jgi:hypothetical protein
MASEISNPTPNVSASVRQAAKVKSYVDQQLEKTRKQVKVVDLIGGGLTLVAFVFGFLILAALIDAWIWPLSPLARWACLIFVVSGCVAYTLTSIVPLLLKRINPDYAAKMIEEAKPSFKNSLLNYVSLRKQPAAIKPAVFDAVSRQAAANLATVPEDATVDRSKLIRLGFVLVGLTLFAVSYKVLSPKDPLQTVARIVFPAGKIAKPAVVKIEDVKPGEANVFFGEPLAVTAVVRGSHDPDDVRLIYSTLDGQLINQTIRMQPEDDSYRYRAEISMLGGGIQQSLTYQIVARDGASPEYKVTVQPNPAIAIESLVLQPPAYTKMRGRTLAGQGDIDAIEGTRATVHAVANLPIQLAYIELLNEVRDPNQAASELDYDARYRLAATAIEMKSEGTSATGSFLVALNSSREKPIASHYRIRFVSTDDDRNRQPNVYPIRVIPDLAPEIRFRNPDAREVEIPVNGELPVLLEANDLDFEIKSVHFKVDHKGSKLLDQKLEMKSEDGNRRVTASYRLCPADLGLRPGDTGIFFGTAADNRMSPYSDQPDPNISWTEKYSFRVTAPDETAEKNPDNQNQSETEQSETGEEEKGGDRENEQSGTGDSDSGSKGSDQSDPSSGEDNGSETGEQSEDSTQSGTKQDKPGEKPGQENTEQQKSGEPGQEQDPESGESGKSDSSEQSGDGDKSGSGGSATEQPDQPPEGGGEGDGEGGESAGQSDSMKSDDNSAGENGGSNSESGDNSSSGNNGDSASDPSGGDPQSNPESQGASDSSAGAGQKDDSLTSGAEEAVSDNASESELIRKMQEHFENEQNQSNDNQQSADNQADSQQGSESGDNANQNAQGQNSESGEPGSETENRADPNQPNKTQGDNAGQPEDKNGSGESDSGEAGSDQPQDGEAGGENSGGADPANAEPKSGSDPSASGEGESGEPKSGEPKSGEPKNGESRSDERKSGEPERGESGSESGESKSGESKPGESKSGESKSGESQDGESGKGESDQGQAGESQSGDAESGGGEPGDSESENGNTGSGEFGKGGDGKGGTGEGKAESSETAEGNPGGEGSEDAGGNTGSGEQSGDQSAGQQPPSGGDQQAGGNKPGSASASGNKPGAGSGDQTGSPDSKQPGGTGLGESSAEGDLLKREKANLEHAKKATDMVLSKLAEQKDNPDPELLRKLKMSKQELQEFFDRWDEMKRKAETGGVEAQKKYERELKSLGLKPKGGRNSVQQNADKVEGLNEDGAVNEPSAELVPDFNKFLRDLGRVRDN